MSRAFTADEFVTEITEDRTWRLREISDLKAAVNRADFNLRRVLLRAAITVCYAHWEGYIRFASKSYLKYVARRSFAYGELQIQFTRNRFLPKLAALANSKTTITDRCNLIDSILSCSKDRFGRASDELVNTKANLNFLTFSDICRVCNVPIESFSDKEAFIDIFLLKRRNEIAHGEATFVEAVDLDQLVDETIELMRAFGNMLENHVSLRAYLAA